MFGSKQGPEESLFSFLGAKLLGPPSSTKMASQTDIQGYNSPSPVIKKEHGRSASTGGKEIFMKKAPMMDHLDQFIESFAADASRTRVPKPGFRGF